MIALRFFIAYAAVLLFLLGPAVAADATSVSVAGIWGIVQPYIEAVASTVIAAVIGWIGTRLNKWLGLNIEARHREALHSAAMTGVHRALAAIGSSTGKLTVNARSVVIAEAVTWVMTSVPDALAYLGASPDKIAAIAEAKLAELLPAAAAPSA